MNVNTELAITPVPQWLGYMGNKGRLTDILMTMTPDSIGTFVDLFGGTGIVGVNAYHYGKCARLLYNELNRDFVHTLSWMNNSTPSQVAEEYRAVKQRYFGDAERIYLADTSAYKHLLNDLNDKRQQEEPYAAEFAFAVKNSKWQQPEYLKNGNLKQHPKANATGRKMMRLPDEFLAAVSKAPIEFYSCDFAVLLDREPCVATTPDDIARFKSAMTTLDENDFVFVDAPYLGSDAIYNRQGEQSWKSAQGQMMDIYLFSVLQKLDEQGVRWMLTNNIEYNTPIFREWVKLWNVYRLESGRGMDGKQKRLYGEYGNSKGRADAASSGEVIVTNYKVENVPGGKVYLYFRGSNKLSSDNKLAWYGLQRKEDIAESIEKGWHME